MRINITERAIEQFMLILHQSTEPESGIRISATQSKCGNPLRMDIEEESYYGDNVKMLNGINFFIEKEAERFLRLVTIDFTGINFKIEGIPERNWS